MSFVSVDGYAGVAFFVIGPETQPDEDTEWTGEESETGMITVCMVGDDRNHAVDPDDIHPLDREAFCGECGQLGCTHDGLDRDNSSEQH